MLEKVIESESERLGCNAGCQQVSWCYTKVNLKNPLCAGNKAGKRGIHPGFEIQGRHCTKTGVLVAKLFFIKKVWVESMNFDLFYILTWFSTTFETLVLSIEIICVWKVLRQRLRWYCNILTQIPSAKICPNFHLGEPKILEA